jgi:hypothetical protein
MSIADGILLRSMLDRLAAFEQHAPDNEAAELRFQRLEQRFELLEASKCQACAARRAGDAARQRRRRATVTVVVT